MMFYTVEINHEDVFGSMVFQFGTWTAAQKFIDDVLIHGDFEKVSVKVRFGLNECEEEEENKKEEK